MSVRVNLLPEARMHTLELRARKRLFTTITTIMAVVAGTILVTLLLLLGYTYSQQRINAGRIVSLTSDIEKQRDLEQNASTLQEHLTSFGTLQASRLYVSEIFTNVGNTIPNGVKITNFQISSDNLVTVTGTAQSIAQVSTFSKALEDYNVDFKPQPGFDRKPFFTTVNITTVSKDVTTGEVKFTMTFQADPSVFNKAPSS